MTDKDKARLYRKLNIYDSMAAAGFVKEPVSELPKKSPKKTKKQKKPDTSGYMHDYVCESTETHDCGGSE